MSRLLQLDADVVEARLGTAPFEIRHNLAGHALFALPRLLELSTRLPAANVEYNAGDVPLTVDPDATPRTGLSIEETIRRVEDCRSWMVLKNVEQDPAYRDLLFACLDEVSALAPPSHRQSREREGFIFITSPGSVTPFHMDHELNFLLQIRGSKTINIFDGHDRDMLPEQTIERFFTGAHRNLTYEDRFAAKAKAFELAPGMGVHVPPTFPHWVKNGGSVSVSFSITWESPASMDRAHVYRMNAFLREKGMEPKPVGVRGAVDQMKAMTWRAKARAAKMLGRDPRTKKAY